MRGGVSNSCSTSISTSSTSITCPLQSQTSPNVTLAIVAAAPVSGVAVIA